MANVIAVFSGNGGVGKSFFSCNLSYGLKSHNKRVLLVEVSFGARADDIILGIKSDSIYNFSDICQGQCKVHEAIVKSEDSHLPDFISAGLDYSACDVESGISSVIKSLSSAYDFIIFDLAASFGAEFNSAVSCADIAIGITDDSVLSVRNTSLAMVNARKCGCKKAYVVLNNVVINGDSACSAEDVADEIGEKILGIVPSDEYVKLSIANSDPIYKYNTYAGRSLENVCKRIMGISVPDFETGVSGGFFFKNKLVLK